MVAVRPRCSRWVRKEKSRMPLDERAVGRRRGLVGAVVRVDPTRVLQLLAACSGLVLALPAGAGVTDADVLNDAKTPKGVVSYGMGPHQHRFSPLNKVNTKTVQKLVPAWTFSFGGEKQRGQQAQPMVYKGK